MDVLSRLYRKNPNFVFRQIADEFVLVPIHHDVADMEAIYTLDGVGARIWELLDGERDGQAVLRQIVEEYDVERETARADLIEFLEQLGTVEAIEPHEVPGE
jgi:hypothetical protein